jgi:hypothetical protein
MLNRCVESNGFLLFKVTATTPPQQSQLSDKIGIYCLIMIRKMNPSNSLKTRCASQGKML